MKKIFLGTATLCLSVVCAQASTSTTVTSVQVPAAAVLVPASDSLTVVNNVAAAFQAHDGEKMFTGIADDVEYTDPYFKKFMGKPAMAEEFKLYRKINLKGQLIGDRKVEGDKVTWTDEFSHDQWTDLGMCSLILNLEATVKDGKIKTITAKFTPESQMRVDDANAKRAKKMAGTKPTEMKSEEKKPEEKK